MKENISGQYCNPEKKKSRFLAPLVFTSIIGATSTAAMANIHQAQEEDIAGNIDTKNPISLITTPEPEQVAWRWKRPLSDQTYLQNYQFQLDGNREMTERLESEQAKINAIIQQKETSYEQWKKEAPLYKRPGGAWKHMRESYKYTKEKKSIAGDLNTIRDNEEELDNEMCSEMVSRNRHHGVAIVFDDGRKVSCAPAGAERIKKHIYDSMEPKIPREYNVPGGGWIQ